MLNLKIQSPESTGIPSECVTNFIARLERKQIPMHSILLMHKDRLIAEGYYAPYRADTLHRMFSISKSFTSIAIGLLADEGKLALDDPIIQYFPDKVPENVHPWIAAMTIRDMLMMRTCHAATTYKVDMQSDWVDSFFTVPPTHPAGRLFHYDTSSAHTLAALVERLSGMKMLDYLKKKLAPLSLSADSYMLTDPFGVSIGGSGLVALPTDLLKFGYLIAHEGNINGKQLLSASYIKAAVSNLSDTRITGPVPSESCGYGYQFWQNEKGGWVCYGMGGQFIICIPDCELLCVTTADTQGIGGGNQVIYDALYEELLPFVQKEPLPENKKAYDKLQKLLSGLAIAPLTASGAAHADSTMAFHSIDTTSSTAPTYANYFPVTAISGAHYKFAENTLGFSDIIFDFRQDGTDNGSGSITFTLHGKKCVIAFGFGHLVQGIFPDYNQKYAASGIWMRPDTLYVKAHIIDAYIGSVHFEFVFGSNDVTVFLKKQEESLFKEYNGHLYGVLQ